jgi:PAS domain S-box-containing protein
MANIPQDKITGKSITVESKVTFAPKVDQSLDPSGGLQADEEFPILVSCVKEYAIFMIDPEGLVRTWNDGAKKIKGYDAEEIIGRHISVFYTKEDVEKGVIAQNLERAKELGSFENEGWRLRKDGTAFWASVVITACYDECHRLTGYAKVTRDISEQKKTADNLVKLVSAQANLMQSSFEKLKFHIENTPLGFIEWDEKFNIKSLSKRAEEIFGWNMQEFISSEKTGITQVYDEDLPEVSGIAKQLLSGKIERNNLQHRNYTKDGRVIWCNWFNSVLKDKEGKVITIMSMVQDITERKENEEKLTQNELSGSAD